MGKVAVQQWCVVSQSMALTITEDMAEASVELQESSEKMQYSIEN